MRSDRMLAYEFVEDQGARQWFHPRASRQYNVAEGAMKPHRAGKV